MPDPKFELPKIYPITDRRVSGLSHLEQARRLHEGGARLIQLRDKTATAGEFYTSALEVIHYARENGLRIVINDRVDIALAVGADGVHLGQDDLPADEARKLLGKKPIIGFSTHSTEQAVAAVHLPIDYLAIGPIFHTSTKENPDPVVGLEGLREIRAAVGDLPLVAIGGIGRQQAREVLSAGADSVAMIGDLLSEASAITGRMRYLLEP